MYNTIQHFIEDDIKKIEKSIKEIITGEKDAEDLSEEVEERVLKLGTDLLGEIYELLDDEIRESISRKKHWNIEHHNQEKILLDTMGKITFKRTWYYNKHTKEYVYLLDKVLGFESGQKITLRSAAKALEETIDSSYSKGGKKAS
ncbi:MAG TPA: ISLre2 family transposase, partial [Clostridiales bacterium]|nr:ISLre2 family transposase [Clostridiales bacterium]